MKRNQALVRKLKAPGPTEEARAGLLQDISKTNQSKVRG